MPKIWLGPVGSVSKGHVLDCAKAPLEQTLRDYDPLLYVRWNARKLKGNGCWEIRRKSEQKTLRPSDIWSGYGITIAYPKYHEIDLVNHVLDVAFLNYNVLTKLKSMDAWNMKDMGEKGKNFVKQAEYLEAKHLEKIEDKAVNELEYNIKQHKSQIRDFKEFINSGGNPYRLADHWDK